MIKEQTEMFLTLLTGYEYVLDLAIRDAFGPEFAWDHQCNVPVPPELELKVKDPKLSALLQFCWQQREEVNSLLMFIQALEEEDLDD